MFKLRYTAQEFIRISQLCGYASKKNAEKYCTGKEELYDEDFEKVHLMNERKLDIKHGQLHPKGRKCHGDDLINDLSKPKYQWYDGFDGSRGMKY